MTTTRQYLVQALVSLALTLGAGAMAVWMLRAPTSVMGAVVWFVVAVLWARPFRRSLDRWRAARTADRWLRESDKAISAALKGRAQQIAKLRKINRISDHW